ncbi:MAG: TetR/AcrR family transcriptional regulator [Tannerellaceae bacterium]|jgi:AcrR family transcriptional regulator|nr:TetR/AcrR family transcriptional regulator [Tannerellaceae bacterium]
MPRTKEQNEAIRTEKKQIIMDAALELFAEAGYVHTSIEQIARQAGVAKGLIYTYFKSKDDLLYNILTSGIDRMSEGLFPEHLTPETFVESVERMFDKITIQKNFFKLYTALSVQPGVVQRLGPLADANRPFHSMVEFYNRHFGERALKELLLMSTLSKGFSILALFGDRQSTLPMDMLKESIVDFLHEKFGLTNREEKTEKSE